MAVREEFKAYYESITRYHEDISKTSMHVYQRIDTLTTVISTSGIFLLATLMTGDEGLKYRVWGLYISIILFAVAVIFNLINQLMSNIAHSKALNAFEKLKIDLENGEDISDVKYNASHKRKERSISKWNNAIKTINFFSIISLIIGIVFSVLTFLVV